MEGDELNFLYCFLLICLDSIIYGLLALLVTKVEYHEGTVEDKTTFPIFEYSFPFFNPMQWDAGKPIGRRDRRWQS